MTNYSDNMPTGTDILYISVFEATPGNSILLKTDTPKFTIVAATPEYLKQTGYQKKDLIGKGLYDAFPVNTVDWDNSAEKNTRASLQHVLKFKEQHYLPIQRYDIRNGDGSFSEKYWKAANTPVLTPGGEVAFIIHTAEDITHEFKEQEQEEKIKSMKQSHNLFMQAPIPIQIYKGRDLILELANDASLAYFGKGPDIIGKPLIEALPEMKEQGYFDLLLQVMDNGTAKFLFDVPVTFIVNGKEQLGYYNAVYQPYYEENKTKAAGVLVLAFDVTEKVLAKKQGEEAKAEAEKQKRLYETITNNTPDLIYVFDLNYRFNYANKALLYMWGKKWEQSIGKGLRDNGYEEWHAEMHEREIDQVVATKQSVRGEVSFPHATLGKRVYDYILVPVINEKGEVEAVAGTTRDITELKLSEQAILESNERFINLANDSPLFVFIIDADPLAPVSYWNKLWLDYTGQTYEEAIGRAWDGILHPDDVPVVMEHYSPAFQNRQPYLIPTVRVKRHDGEYRWHAFKGNPRYSASGVFNGYVGVGFDVHEQKLAEEALKESEARARAAIDIALLGTFEINVHKQTIIHSERTAQILGLDPAKQWSYQAIIDTVQPEDQAIRLKALEEAKHTGMLFYEARIIHPDLSIRWVRLYGRYIRQDNQPKIIGTLMDVTEERKAAEVLEQKVEERTKELEQVVQALKRSNQELARSNTNLEEFAYAASHDLKEPIRKVSTFLDRLKRSLQHLTTTEKQLFDRVENATQRMGLLVEDLLQFSHVSERPAEKEEVDLNVKIERVLTDLELQIEEKQAKIRVGKMPVVFGYRRQLQQLFQNLIGNALKYNQPEQPPVVTVSSQIVFGKNFADKVLPDQAEQRFHLIQVTDNGIGFEQAYAEKIFKMFQRLHSKAEYPGTGVGLSIARKVIENHSGYIWAESQPGRGSTFNVLLPS